MSWRERLSDERGYTLIELVMATAAGLVVCAAALAIVVSSLSFANGDSERIDSNQQGSVAMEKIVQALNSSCVVGYGISPIVGATGWTDEDRTSFESMCDEYEVGAAIVPNFAIGAVLAMRFAESAARYFPTVEIIEMHSDRKRDAPSGTAKLTAERIAAGGGPSDVPIHSVRLRGLVAHQAVIFGGDGETLNIRHDSLSRTSFMSGVLLAVRGVRSLKRLVLGLDWFLGDFEG